MFIGAGLDFFSTNIPTPITCRNSPVRLDGGDIGDDFFRKCVVRRRQQTADLYRNGAAGDRADTSWSCARQSMP